MATTTRSSAPASVRSDGQIPLRPAGAAARPADTRAGRIPLSLARPGVPDGLYRPKAVAGEAVPFGVTAFREGHDIIGVHVRLFAPAGAETLHRLAALHDGFDRWRTLIAPLEQGVWRFRFEAFGDDFATWEHAADLKIAAGVDAPLMREMGATLFDRAAAETARPVAERRALSTAAATLRDASVDDTGALLVVRDPTIARFFAERPVQSLVTVGEDRELLVERELRRRRRVVRILPALRGRPTAEGRLDQQRHLPHRGRSASPPSPTWGSTSSTCRPSTRSASEPQGPQQHAHRRPRRPGLALGDRRGGGRSRRDPPRPRNARRLPRVRARRAATKGLEVALDLALQASPDHPWVTSIPSGSRRCPTARSPTRRTRRRSTRTSTRSTSTTTPTASAPRSLRIVRHWIAQGVKIFRVDNPHTKPLQFWEWLIATVNAEHPDVIFLAEAFTRPAPLQRTRDGRLPAELLLLHVAQHEGGARGVPRLDLATRPPTSCGRTSSSTPRTSSPSTCSTAGAPAYKIRAAIAATGAAPTACTPGYELFENVARPGPKRTSTTRSTSTRSATGRPRRRAGDSLAPYLRRLNEIRRAHPALRQLRGLSVHWSDDDAILVYVKHLPADVSPDRRVPTRSSSSRTSTRTRCGRRTVHIDIVAVSASRGDTTTTSRT